MVDRLQQAFEQFQSDGNADRFLIAIFEFGGYPPDSELDTPIAHRICDVNLNDVGYRIVRVVDVDDRSTRLFIYQTEIPNFKSSGVPYALQGDALFQWVMDELENPTEWEVDWGRYDPSLAVKNSE